MKKIIVGIFAFALLLGGNTAFAAGPFNGQDGDCPNMGIGNYTTGTGIADGQYNCWSTTSVSATAGQVVNVGMFYHNNTNQPLTNVKASLSQSTTGPGTSFSFSGNMTSDQGSTSLGTVTLNVNSSQTVTFNSAYWFKNQHDIDADIDSPFPGGQSPSSLMNGGINLGSVPAGWSDYGYIVAVFRISENNNVQTCTDPSASNYGSVGNCVFPQYQACAITNFQPSPTYVSQGQSSSLVWSTSNCTSATVTGPTGVISNSINGSVLVYPQGTSSYTIHAYGANGSHDTRTVQVTVNQQQYNNCYVSINASPSYVTSGQPSIITWNGQNCTSVTVSGPGLNNNSISGSQTVYPTYTSTYTITGYSSYGTPMTQSVTVTVNQPQIIIPTAPIIVNNCAVTTIATNLTRNSAQLNGLVSNANAYNGTGYFQYGTSINLGSQTAPRSLNGISSFSETITGLAADTVYYFRFVSNCGGAQSFGKTEVFSTLPAVTTTNTNTNTTTTRQVIVQGTTVVGTQSPIMLKIENRYEFIGVGDLIDYTVTYKNIGSSVLTHPVLQVIVPKGITITNSSGGTYSVDTNTLTVPLQDLFPGAEGVVYLQARVDSLPVGTAQIVSSAVLVYTSPNGAQENAIAYVLNRPKDLNQNLLGASAFFAGIFPGSLIGWLLLLIIILVIVLLARRYARRPMTPVYTTVPPPPAHH